MPNIAFLSKKNWFEKIYEITKIFNPFQNFFTGETNLRRGNYASFFTCPGEKVLIVGFQIYNLHYPLLYLQSPVTVSEIEPKIKKLVLLGEVLIGKFEEFPTKSRFENFSLIHFNGVYGWGVNTHDQMIRAVKIINSLLKPDGILIFGHNIFNHNPLNMEKRYQEYFFSLTEIKNSLFPVVRSDLNQIFRIFKKI